MEQSGTVLRASALSKIYSGVSAVDNVSMTINKGDIYGFVGLNGSGKTTFIRLITGLIKPSGGAFSLFDGREGTNREALKKVSSIVETPSLYQNLSALDNMKIQCDICSVKDTQAAAALLELVRLDPKSKKIVKNFSLGMRQRLAIAVSLVGNPEFLILDEPTNGLDPEGIVEIRTLLQRLNTERGMTILISSHILNELSRLATKFGFIHKGRLIKEASIDEIHSSVRSKLSFEADDNIKAVAALEGYYPYIIQDSSIVVDCDMPLSDFADFMKERGVKILSATKRTQDLEGYFINLIGGGRRI